MTNSFWKQNAFWWVPIVVVVLTGTGWAIKEYYMMTSKPGVLFGRLAQCPGEVSIFIDGTEVTKTSQFCHFRIENINPGKHEIQWQYTGFDPKYSVIEISGGIQNRIDLPALQRALPTTEPAPKVQETITVSTQVNTWYAGTRYFGTVDMREKYGFSWKCSGGTCTLSGPYGKGLNMEVCQALSRAVGGLEYYYNDAGMKWTKMENSALLDQCNGVAATENAGASPASQNPTNNLTTLLSSLVEPVADCLTKNDTEHPAFHGCVDWHSSVHAVWALIRYRRVTGDTSYDSLIHTTLSDVALSEEFTYLKSNPYFEMPYGRAWFLRLVIDYERAFGSDKLKAMGDFLANSLHDHYANMPLDPYDKNYTNPSWALVNFYQYSKYRQNNQWVAFVESLVESNYLASSKKCKADDVSHSSGFLDVCGNWAYLVAETGQVQSFNHWVNHFYSDTGLPAPVISPKDPHEKGLNFSRAWSYWYIYENTQEQRFSSSYLEHIEAQINQPNWWSGNDYDVTHWVAQFGVYSLTAQYN